MGPRVARYTDLEVYRLAFDLQQRVFEVSKSWPREEKYALTDQVRRASRSVGANIAEAWAKRRYEAHFVSKLTDADGELNETRHWTGTAHACRYIDDTISDELMQRCEMIGRKIGKIIGDAPQWVTTA